jgi:hypothetical protein
MPLDDQSSPPPSARRRVLPIDRLSQRLRAVRPRVTRDTARFVWMSILPVGIALVSLVLSLYGVIADREPPDVVVTMPDRVRIAQGADAAWLYLQPRFVNTGGNNRNEVINHVTVEVAPLPDGTPVPFAWDEQGTWLDNPDTTRIDWQFLADPAPIVVGPNAPQFPIGLFIAPSSWTWQPGTYRVTVIADRTIERVPLLASLELTLTATDVEVVSDSRGFLREVMTSPAE